ncbi:adenylate/guanylate cyclase domain-containing protein [Nocardia huaxiensis]|uniref:Adenylate/guanylate cyclase domain-containing protein n=1 Tax=Nocardia huaxiensis TaxID=2755382 RepID=A0A7D6ZS76_9NOCA|nr:adenylate/guanylate cyclase domain-containing protein [Nocardia huaxiensis]QLY34043.1 adenylate/guanylate cyclase domain-containing protein [Nocardia huaxiensis]UFT00183.1 adenylate/guanylate cyclase domain-containing protein [Nocardia huaxiensis]
MMASPEISKLVQSVVEPYLLNGERKYNRREVAAKSGAPTSLTRRLWIALGFPAHPDDDAIEYSDADIAAAKSFGRLKVLAGADIHRQTTAARTLGRSMARLAEWQVDLITEEILYRTEARMKADPAANQEDVARVVTEEVMNEIEALMTYAFRRHLDAALARSLDEGSVAGDTMRVMAVGFADMVGYTRLTRHLEPDELSSLLEAFEAATSNAIIANGGWVIKNVGDEVMFAANTAEEGARIALAVQEAATASHGVTQELRVGLAYGEVLQRFGDLYGSVVNVAARLTGVARPGTVLVDDGAAAAIAGNPQFELTHLRGVRVRGINRLRGHVLRRNVIRPLV